MDDYHKTELDNLMKISSKKSLRELASDIKFTKEFQETYVDSYYKMSERGIGFLGKKVAMVGDGKK